MPHLSIQKNCEVEARLGACIVRLCLKLKRKRWCEEKEKEEEEKEKEEKKKWGRGIAGSHGTKCF